MRYQFCNRSRDNCAIPSKNKEFCDPIATSIARHAKYRLESDFLSEMVKMAEVHPVQKWSLENALGVFLQTPAPVLDKISGPLGARFFSSTGLRFGTLIGRAQFFPVPALDKHQSPTRECWEVLTSSAPQERKISPMRKFLGRTSRGHPGSFARISRPRTSVRAVKILEKTSILAWTSMSRRRGRPRP